VRAMETRSLTCQGPLELLYVHDLSWAFYPSGCDSTQRVRIADHIAILGHFRPKLSHNMFTTWMHDGTLRVLGCSLVP
jgi:hypothetical protein